MMWVHRSSTHSAAPFTNSVFAEDLAPPLLAPAITDIDLRLRSNSRVANVGILQDRTPLQGGHDS